MLTFILFACSSAVRVKEGSIQEAGMRGFKLTYSVRIQSVLGRATVNTNHRQGEPFEFQANSALHPTSFDVNGLEWILLHESAFPRGV